MALLSESARKKASDNSEKQKIKPASIDEVTKTQEKDLERIYEDKVLRLTKKLEGIRKTRILLLFLGDESISRDTVTTVYDKLEKEYKGIKKLDVIIDSGGGDIDSAYLLAKLFRKYASERLTFIVPRWAKSAATLTVCGGDEIIMGPISELGPLDPQITEINPLEPEKSIRLTPLAIRSTLDLIEEELSRGKRELAHMMAEQLLPLKLGVYLKSLEIGQRYQEELLKSRMLCKHKDKEKICSTIAEKFAKGYPDHGFCIDAEEASKLNLNILQPKKNEWSLIWQIYKLYDEERTRKFNLETKRELDNLLDRLKEDLKKRVGILDEKRKKTRLV